LEAHKPVELFL